MPGELNKHETQVVLECLKATTQGPFFPDWEFSTLFGLSREEVAEVAAAWPNVDQDSKTVVVAINNSLNNLLGYPHGCQEVWDDYISVPPEELGAMYARWRQESVNYFGGLM